ncbi:MAG: penicillin-binding transpeptidase domain-containing protein [Mariprofundaceae bacterium]|nr:penicillin-binding transpeptidase domain-containing protein [Mariprofundaceae bacterium]
MKNRESIFIRRRLEAVAACLALGIALLAIRAVDLQWLQADKLTNMAEKQRYRQFTVIAPRGTITDTKGRILAESIEVPSIAAIASEVPQKDMKKLARALKMPLARLRQKLEGRKGFVWLARQVSPETAERIMALNVPGVRQETEWRRYQPLGPQTGHLLGFVGVDGHGLEGLEHSLDRHLAGNAGTRLVQRDARGRSLPGGIWLRKPVIGQSVRLTLDASIQSMAYTALADGIRRQNAKGGSVVVIRPQDGAILAMASWPGFNPNNFGKFRPDEWRNRAATDVFEPGSALKPFTVAAALASGKWQPDSRVYCEKGQWHVAGHIIHDDHPEAWLDMPGLLAKSSNIGAAKLALDVGAKRMHRMLSEIGLGRRSNIGLSGESPGILPPIQRWGPIETANIAFGQGVAVTPLQLATAFCILANGGLYIHPKLIDGDNHQPVRRVLPEQVARQVMLMLEYATSPEGTGRHAVPAGYRVAGKTGTAQKADANGSYASDRFTAVFAGAVPADNPRLVIVVVVDEPQGSIYGGQVAAPIFRHIAESALPYLGVLPQIKKDAPQWKAMPIVAGTEIPATAGGSLYGLSLREVRRVAAVHGYRLRTHGSGWVVRQSPRTLHNLMAKDIVEVWLDE